MVTDGLFPGWMRHGLGRIGRVNGAVIEVSKFKVKKAINVIDRSVWVLWEVLKLNSKGRAAA